MKKIGITFLIIILIGVCKYIYDGIIISQIENETKRKFYLNYDEGKYKRKDKFSEKITLPCPNVQCEYE
jgi:uncharacterized protein with PQ loop repeat